MRNLAVTLRSPSLELALAAFAIALVLTVLGAVAFKGLPSTSADAAAAEARPAATPWTADIPTRSVVLGIQKPPRDR